jgi:nucleotide-binding universal stress UspA family protein
VSEFRRIVCPSDFSGASGRALGQAIRVARRHGSSLLALHVVPVGLPASARFSALTNPALLRPGIREETAKALRRFVERVGPAGLPVGVEVREGRPAEEIVKRAAALRADLLVIGAHGRSGFEKWVLGSVTERVLRSAHAPVLVVPARGALPAGPALFGTIVCATDFSPPADAALQHAVALARLDGSRLILVHVVAHASEAAPGGPPDAAGELQERAREWLRRAVPADLRAHCAVEEVVAAGKPHREIARVAREAKAGLIVVGTQGADALDRLVFGSTAHRVLRAAPCCVLAVRAG